MRILLDTNILARSAQPDHPQHKQARDAVKLLLERGDTPCLVPQNCYEFWTVATRPSENNGLNWTTHQTDAELSKLLRIFEPLSFQDEAFSDTPELFTRWRALVLRYDVKGKSAHDARIVAAMTLFSVSRILTFNKSDFTRFEEITAVTPEELLQARKSQSTQA